MVLTPLSNFMMIGVMRPLDVIQCRCPEDVSLIGVDDLDWAGTSRRSAVLNTNCSTNRGDEIGLLLSPF